jgi:hypothetical protein
MAPRLKKCEASKSELRKVFQVKHIFSFVQRTKQNLKINFYDPNQFTSIINNITFTEECTYHSVIDKIQYAWQKAYVII